MSRPLEADLCILGAGAGGLAAAAGAAQMGARVALVEPHAMGGDCLNTGCVPSKALLAAAAHAEAMRRVPRFGVQAGEPEVDWRGVHRYVHGVIGAIAPHDSQERFEGLGVTVIRAPGRFLDPRTVEAGEFRITARRFVVATGSRPALPPFPGLESVPYFTNETIFDHAHPLPHLLVIGAGPIGMEMAQAHRRLGSEVTVVDLGRPLPREDPELAELVVRRMTAEGVHFRAGVTVRRIETGLGGVALVLEQERLESRVDGSHLLIAAGRKPNVEGLGLEAAGIHFTPAGIKVDDRLRTTNRRVFAIGDVTGGFQFTHAAGYHAGIVLRNALFHLPARVDYSALPRVTYTDPELAHVGLSEEEARRAETLFQVLRKPFGENDRARAEGDAEGMIKIILGKKGRILGASIVGAHAGELILPWVLAVQQKMGIGVMAGIIAPYPTRSEISKGVAGQYYTPKLFSPGTRRLVRWLGMLG
ncbi:MAG: FAD-dependent oxidoreductase [Magnetococcales bacterium]|nr:FAD-dependent oxidoreductase [Magnetococcales bacterium]